MSPTVELEIIYHWPAQSRFAVLATNGSKEIMFWEQQESTAKTKVETSALTM